MNISLKRLLSVRENPAILVAGMNLSFLDTDKKIPGLLSPGDSFSGSQVTRGLHGKGPITLPAILSNAIKVTAVQRSGQLRII